MKVRIIILMIYFELILIQNLALYQYNLIINLNNVI